MSMIHPNSSVNKKVKYITDFNVNDAQLSWHLIHKNLIVICIMQDSKIWIQLKALDKTNRFFIIEKSG